MKEILLRDVAQRAGVSPSTVTRVARKNGYVSPEKRRMVVSAMEELGYTPRRASAPASKGAPKVAVFLLSSKNPLFSCIAEQMGMALQGVGWQMIPFLVDGGSAAAQEVVDKIEALRKGNLRGVVLNCMGDALDFMPHRRYLSALSVPLVMIERAPDIYGLNKVMLHSKEMLFIAVKYLAHRGHRKIAFFGVDNGRDVENMRKSGFWAGAAAMGIEDDARFWPIGDYGMESGERAMGEYAAQNGLPTAVIADDHTMVGVSNWLYERGRRVPEDVSLVGLDDTLARFATPQLTSVAFPVAEIVQNTVRILIEAQQGDALPQNILLSTKLVERRSVGTPRAGE